MCRPILNEKAFTLIEVIVSLVLIGILATIAGMGLVQITQGYVFAKQNAETAQKVQIAMARIVKELGIATTITAAGTNSVTFMRPESATTSITNTIELSGGAVQIRINNGGASTLIDNVTAFDLAIFDAAGNSTTTAANIRRVDITLTVSGANNQFKNTVWIQESY
jgi:prepilin-type N-terminal cleavage/methylation domain-containing protein